MQLEIIFPDFPIKFEIAYPQHRRNYSAGDQLIGFMTLIQIGNTQISKYIDLTN